VARGSVNPVAINDKGQILATGASATSDTHSFPWEDGKLTDFGTLGGNATVASAINERGEIVGWSSPAGSTQGRASLWRSGRMRDLGTLGT
jgi:probable HAF family extracellular repeat protein